MQIQLKPSDKPQEFKVIEENEETETHVLELIKTGEIITVPFVYSNAGFPKIFA